MRGTGQGTGVGSLAALWIGAIRELMLSGRLGATLVESADPPWTPDPGPEPTQTDFRRALARLSPVFMPGLLFRLEPDGTG